MYVESLFIKNINFYTIFSSLAIKNQLLLVKFSTILFCLTFIDNFVFQKNNSFFINYIFFNNKTFYSILVISKINKFFSQVDISDKLSWVERESSELFGVFFTFSKDTRSLLLPYSFIKNPLNKIACIKAELSSELRTYEAFIQFDL